MSLCFQAPLPTGSLRLALPVAAADAVAAALALDAHEGLLAALEQALQQPLDPRPVPSFGAEPLADPTLWADAGDGVRVGLPWSALAALGEAPRWPLRWPTLSFEVELAAFAQRPLPEAAAEGVLLLPPAFQAPWRVLLHAAEHGLAMDAEWRGPGSDIVCHAAPEPAADPRPPWRVVLAERFERPLAQWLGWEAAPPLSAGAAAALVGPAGQAAGPSAGPVAPASAQGSHASRASRVSKTLSELSSAELCSPPAMTAAPFAHLLPAGERAVTATGPAAPGPAAPSRIAGRIAPALDGAALWI